jgi:hypothetical protein
VGGTGLRRRARGSGREANRRRPGFPRRLSKVLAELPPHAAEMLQNVLDIAGREPWTGRHSMPANLKAKTSMTVWDGVNPFRTEEIKTNPENTKRAQLRRINQARAAVLDGGPLPGDNASELLYDLDPPLRTHLDVLRDALERAATDGIYATPVPGSRALFGAMLMTCGSASGGTRTAYLPE